MRVIGLDVGGKRLGVAVSDPLGKTAQPYDTLKMSPDVFDRLGELAVELGAVRLVVGLPLLLDGSEGAQASIAREFAREAEEKTGLPVVLQDERLSTREAESVLAGQGMAPGLKKEASDRLAAALILRRYLDGLPGE